MIYRTKEDVRDWDGQPLFPGRHVAPPVVVDLGPDYRDWIERIHDYFSPGDGAAKASTARRRSADWRCAEALQWAASSPQAGLGYLVRQAIRAGWTCQDRLALAEALRAIRPYRMGPPDEPIERLFERISKEIDRQKREADVEDIEELDDESPDPDAPTLDVAPGRWHPARPLIGRREVGRSSRSTSSTPPVRRRSSCSPSRSRR